MQPRLFYHFCSHVPSMFAGMIAGATGAFIGTPAEVSLIRMTSDGRLLSWNIYIYFLMCIVIILQASYS